MKQIRLIMLLVCSSIGLDAQMHPFFPGKEVAAEKRNELILKSNPFYMNNEILKAGLISNLTAKPVFSSRSSFDIKLDSIVQHELDPTSGYQRLIKYSFLYHPTLWKLAGEELVYFNTATGEVGYGSRIDYTYDANGHVTLYKIYFNPSYSGHWEEYGQTTFTYNEKGLLTNEMNEIKESDSLIPYDQKTYTYNQYDLLVSRTQFDWDLENSEWVELTRYDYEYTPFKQVMRITYLTHETGEWLPYHKVENTYGQGLLLSATEYNWESGWDPDYRYEYSYDGNKNLIMRLENRRDENAPVWIPDNRYSFEYDGSNRLVSSDQYYYLLGHFPPWYPKDSLYLTYDAFNNTLSETYYYGSGGGGVQWSIETQINHEYDTQIKLEDIAWPHNPLPGETEILPFTSGRVFTKTIDYAGGEIDSSSYHYNLVTRTSEIASIPRAVHPNPASDIVYIDLASQNEEIEIMFFNPEGKQVLHTSVIGNKPISIKALSEGSYFLMINDNGKLSHSRLIIQR